MVDNSWWLSIPVSVILISVFLSPVSARRGWSTPGRFHRGGYPRYEIGFGSYSHSYESNKRSDSWSGYSLRGSYYSAGHVAGRMSLYSTDADLVNYFGTKTGTSEITGVSMAGLMGTNWGRGFNMFGGLGLYAEDFDWDEHSGSWSGYLILYGVGYRWEHVSLELSAELRETSDPDEFYRDELGVTGDSNQTYSSGSLTVGVSFF